MILNDTILAISSPQGPTGIRTILRLSGPDAWTLPLSLTTTPNPQVGWHNIHLTFAHLHLNAHLLLFQAPRSFTGQNIAELHLPNSPALAALLTDELLARAARLKIPARLANPGEFSARAFFNNKIDLTQAEGIAATINAQNQSQLRAAAGLRSGDLHRGIHALAEKLAATLALIEAGIDFSDEEGVSFIAAEKISGTLQQIAQYLDHLLATSLRIDRLDALPTIAFVGNPNVGKSSLINALTNNDRSIVSPTAGTTRDILAATLHTPRGNIRLLDLPGKEDPTSELQQKMMAARDHALLDADLIIEVTDTPASFLAAQQSPADTTTAHITLLNKADLHDVKALLRSEAADPLLRSEAVNALLSSEAANTRVRSEAANTLLRSEAPPANSGNRKVADSNAQKTPRANGPTLAPREDHPPSPAPEPFQLVSAKTGHNIPQFRAALEKMAVPRDSLGTHSMVLNHRHRTLLHQTKSTLLAAARIAHATTQSPELLAAELRHALDLLGQITGTISPDEVLGKIFSQFCIGK